MSAESNGISNGLVQPPAAPPPTISPPSASSHKPSVLIIGGLGYIGRFLALHVHKNSLASEVRLVDKQLPELAWLAPEFSEACSRDKFMQADASREQSLARIFTRPTPNAHLPYDYVFNCGGETRYSQPDSIYKLRSHALSLAIGAECARRHVPVMIELSTGHVYSPNRVPRKETDKCKPSTKQAKWKLQAEEDLAKVDGLNCVVLRLANVYGPYASGAGLATALCMARVYQSEGREMKWLWDKELRCNTVHVNDVIRAMWASAEWYTKKMGTNVGMRKLVESVGSKTGDGDSSLQSVMAGLEAVSVGPAAEPMGAPSTQPTSDPQPSQPPQPPPTLSPPSQRSPALRPIPTYNIVDRTQTTQSHLSTLLSTHFNITCTFASALTSAFARLHLDSVVNAANDDLLDPWADLLQDAGITRPGPISPFMEREMLGDRELSLDGTAFERETGFRYMKEKLGMSEVEEVIVSWKSMGWWP